MLDYNSPDWVFPKPGDQVEIMGEIPGVITKRTGNRAVYCCTIKIKSMGVETVQDYPDSQILFNSETGEPKIRVVGHINGKYDVKRKRRS